jgi:multidrug efflux pump subunit AcrA (membrane-fusion protein)
LCWCHSSSDQSAATKQIFRHCVDVTVQVTNQQPLSKISRHCVDVTVQMINQQRANKLMIGQIATECSYSDTLSFSIFS